LTSSRQANRRHRLADGHRAGGIAGSQLPRIRCEVDDLTVGGNHGVLYAIISAAGFPITAAAHRDAPSISENRLGHLEFFDAPRDRLQSVPVSKHMSDRVSITLRNDCSIASHGAVVAASDACWTKIIPIGLKV
jgi:hypothetical protein